MRWALIAAAVVSGCASQTPALPLYGDVLYVARQGATGLSSPTELRLLALQDAEAKCRETSKAMEMVEIVEAKPPFILGNFPRAEVRFRCVTN